MRTIASLAATAILLCAPFGFSLAQNAPDSGTSAAPATTAAPATPAAPAAPAAPAPAAQTPPANAAEQANSPAANPPAPNTPTAKAPAATTDNTPKDNTPKTRKKRAAGTARRQEVEKSIESGTVPSRYRSSVPKEYQQYIPFSKD
jgi:hypothetical protein